MIQLRHLPFFVSLPALPMQRTHSKGRLDGWFFLEVKPEVKWNTGNNHESGIYLNLLVFWEIKMLFSQSQLSYLQQNEVVLQKTFQQG